jgi:AcrR family transcriptional regulator
MSLAHDLAAQRRAGAMESIAAAALELFERDGFDATSVDAIALAARSSQRTFYRYFAAKEDVIFYDREESLEELGRTISGLLENGRSAWEATAETYINLIGRFDKSDPGIPARRMRLCLREPALWSAYLRFVYDAEQVVAEQLHRHRGTTPATDDYPQLVAIAATGAYRATLFTHGPVGNGRELCEHLRAALATFENGLGTSKRADASRS